MSGLQAWEPSELPRVRRITDDALPGEELGDSQLVRLWSHGGAVLGAPQDSGVVAVMVREATRTGHIRLLAVRPAARRQGVAARLVDAALSWMADRGASSATFGADIPYYLWPGIDAAWLPALALAQDFGFRATGIAHNLRIDTGVGERAASGDPGPGATICRLADDARGRAIRDMVAANWPIWVPEFELGLSGGTAFGAFVEGQAAGFANHSNLRVGWIGPAGTDPRYRHRGIATALIAATCADLRRSGRGTADIAWVGPLGYMLDLGAGPGRVFVRCTRDL